MKKTAALLSLALLMAAPSVVAAAGSTPNTPVSATVDSLFQLTITIREEIGINNGIPVFGPVVSAMNHGTLVRDGDFALRGKAFHVFLGANSGAQPYSVASDRAPLNSPAGPLPRALGVFPISATSDGVSVGGTLATAQDAVGNGKLLYTSNAEGQAATIELVYGLSGGNADETDPFPGWEPIPPTQAPGVYTSTIVYTLTA